MLVRFTLRLDRELRDQAAALAARNGRSLAAEVRAALAKHVRPLELQAISEGQRRAFYAKCTALDRQDKVAAGTWKQLALHQAAERFGREIASATELYGAEASSILDWLSTQLESALPASAADAGVAAAKASYAAGLIDVDELERRVAAAIG